MIARFKNILREYWVEIVLIPPFLVGLCYFFYGDAYMSSWRNIVLMTAPWLVTSILSPICCHWVRRTTLERFTRLEDWPKRVVWSILGYLFFTVGFAKATFFILSNIHYENLAPSEKNFTGLLIFSGMSVLIISTLYEGITYFEKWKSVLTENEQLEKLSLETQFQSLQSQLNPHFLFNSLNVLSSLIAENPRRAEDFVDELSNVYRYLLRANEYELVSVAEELRFIRSYFHLLETRHDTGIELKIKVSPAAQQQKLPALALQILLENAVKHNEISPEKPLSVEILEIPIPSENTRSSGLAHKILVRNNLQTKRSNAASNRVGLQNLRSRYELLGISGFEVEAKDGHFNVILPLI